MRHGTRWMEQGDGTTGSDASHPAQLCRVAEAVCRVSTPAASAAHAAPVGVAAGLKAVAAAVQGFTTVCNSSGSGPRAPSARNAPVAACSEVNEACPCRRLECRRHRLLRDEGDVTAPTLSLDRTSWRGEVIQRNPDGRDAYNEMVVPPPALIDAAPAHQFWFLVDTGGVQPGWIG